MDLTYFESMPPFENFFVFVWKKYIPFFVQQLEPQNSNDYLHKIGFIQILFRNRQFSFLVLHPSLTELFKNLLDYVVEPKKFDNIKVMEVLSLIPTKSLDFKNFTQKIEKMVENFFKIKFFSCGIVNKKSYFDFFLRILASESGLIDPLLSTLEEVTSRI